jgi:site-specific recombinase XerD
MACLKKVNGIWRVRIRYGGKEKSISTHHSIRRDAEIILRKYQLNEQEVKLGLAEHLIDQNLTIIECKKYFFQNYPKEKGIEKSTMNSYKYAVSDFELCFSYVKRFKELNRRHSPILVDFLKIKYSKTTVNIRLRGIRAFLNYLFEKEYVKSIPFRVKEIKVDKHPPKFLTPDELEVIYSNVINPNLFSVYKTLEVTGMRVGELRNSFRDGNYIKITKSKGRNERIIPIPAEYIYHYDIAKDVNYSESWITHSFTRTVRKCKIEGKKTVHSLRHTFSYRMLIELNNIQLVRDILGHSSIAVTELYTRIPIGYLKQVFTERLSNQTNQYAYG